MPFCRRALSTTSTAMLLTLSAPLLAQEAAGANASEATPSGTVENVELNEIVVTAQRRAQRLLDVPLAVSAVTGEQFERSGLTSIDDLVTQVPSLTFGASATSRGEGLVIRGFGTAAFSDAAEGAVGIVLDGVVLGRQVTGLTDLVDIERIEVLRGPQGTLFGKNASAGVVHVITKRPTDEFEVTGRASYSSFNTLRLAASVSGPIAGDTVMGRLTAFRNDTDGYINQVNPAFGRDEVNGREDWGVRGKLLFQPSDNLDVLLTGEYQKQDATCCNWQLRSFSPSPIFGPYQRALLNGLVTPGPDNRNVALAIRSNFQNSETKAASADISFSIGEHRLRSITAYRDFDISEGNKTDQLPASWFDLAATDSRIKQFTQEAQLLSPDEGPFTYVLGAFYFDLDVDSLQRQELNGVQLAPGTTPLPPSVAINLVPAAARPIFSTLFPTRLFVNEQPQSQRTRNMAVFGQATWNINEQFSLTAGARLLNERLRVRFSRTGGLPIGGFGQRVVGVDDENEDTAFVYMGSLQYKPSEDVSLYGTYSRGYKGAAYELNSANIVTFDAAGNPRYEPLKPENVDNFEVGVRSYLLDRRLQLNVTAFLTNVENFQAEGQRVDAPGFILSNVGKFRTKGVELEFAARPSRYFDVGGNIAYVDAEYARFPGAQCPPVTAPSQPLGCSIVNGAVVGLQNLSGRPAANSPDWTANLFANANAPLGEGVEGFVRGELNFRSDNFFALSGDPNTQQDGFELVNARAGVRFGNGRYEIAAFGRNLFDVDYAFSIFNTPVLGGYSQFLAPGRELGVELRFNF